MYCIKRKQLSTKKANKKSQSNVTCLQSITHTDLFTVQRFNWVIQPFVCFIFVSFMFISPLNRVDNPKRPF